MVQTGEPVSSNCATSSGAVSTSRSASLYSASVLRVQLRKGNERTGGRAGGRAGA